MSEFKSWDELSDLEQAQCQFWDMYKDAYGFRPRGIDTSEWTMENFTSTFDDLANVIRANEEERDAFEAKAVDEFNASIFKLIDIGAKDVETAKRWLMEASDCQGDWEYFAYCNRLPYGFFR